jgi:catechol 2,3-dioxygenase-like lactoylglutathione lyase family enzyme
VTVQLNHTIVSCRDQQRSAAFLTGILGLPAATWFAHFLVVEADNGVSLDFAETTGAITPQHYAFLVGEDEDSERIRTPVPVDSVHGFRGFRTGGGAAVR